MPDSVRPLISVLLGSYGNLSSPHAALSMTIHSLPLKKFIQNNKKCCNVMDDMIYY